LINVIIVPNKENAKVVLQKEIKTQNNRIFFSLSIEKNHVAIHVIIPIKTLVIKTPDILPKREDEKTFPFTTSLKYDNGKTKVNVNIPEKSIIAKNATMLNNIKRIGATTNQKTTCNPSSISPPKNKNDIQDDKIAKVDKPNIMISKRIGGMETEIHVINDAVK